MLCHLNSLLCQKYTYKHLSTVVQFVRGFTRIPIPTVGGAHACLKVRAWSCSHYTGFISQYATSVLRRGLVLSYRNYEANYYNCLFQEVDDYLCL